MKAWNQVLDFWLPAGIDKDFDTHKRHMEWAFRGGADQGITERFGPLTERAIAGELDDWARTPDGRLALIIVLDQFPRSLYRDRPEAYAQDPKALGLTLEGLDNGHYDALAHPWEKLFFALPLGHAEGPDHLARIDRSIELADAMLETCPSHLRPLYEFSTQQPRLGRKVIEAFGRHPHRNDILGRASTAEEREYLAKGEFPHTRKIDLESP